MNVPTWPVRVLAISSTRLYPRVHHTASNPLSLTANISPISSLVGLMFFPLDGPRYFKIWEKKLSCGRKAQSLKEIFGISPAASSGRLVLSAQTGHFTHHGLYLKKDPLQSGYRVGGHVRQVQLIWITSTELDVVLPASSSAFGALVDFCSSRGILEECFLALAVVMMIPGYADNPLTIPKTTASMFVDSSQGPLANRLEKLRRCLDSCITLSCSFNGIESLLCSSFFEPSIPCNLVGAYLLGVRRAIDKVQRNEHDFAQLMARRSPELGLLWLAATSTSQSSKILKSGLSGMPPLNLAVASWTNAIQSFV